MKEYEKNLHLVDSVFDKMRADADAVLQGLLKNMVEKESTEGKVGITIGVNFSREFIPNRDPEVQGETRIAITPTISHKVCSVMQIKNDMKGYTKCEGMELVFDRDTGECVLKPVANTDQMSIFDSEFSEVFDGGDTGKTEKEAIEGSQFLALPEPVDDDDDYDYEPGEE